MVLNELSDNVYKHFIRHAVPDVTDEEISSILRLYPNSNPLDHTTFFENMAHSNDIPKEGPRDFYICVVSMTMCSYDPIRKAFRLAIEYINDDGLIDDESIEESVDAYESLYKMRVQWLREGDSNIDDNYDSDIDDNWRGE